MRSYDEQLSANYQPLVKVETDNKTVSSPSKVKVTVAPGYLNIARDQGNMWI